MPDHTTDYSGSVIRPETVTVPKDTFTDLVDGILGMRSAIEDMNSQIAALRKEVGRVTRADPFRSVLRTGHVPIPAPITYGGGPGGSAPTVPLTTILVQAHDLVQSGAKLGVGDRYMDHTIKKVVEYRPETNEYLLEIE